MDVAIEKLYKCAYFIVKEDLAFRKLESLLRLLRECGVEGNPRMYKDNKACASVILHICKVLEAEIYDRLITSPWFGLMVNCKCNQELDPLRYVCGRKASTNLLFRGT